MILIILLKFIIEQFVLKFVSKQVEERFLKSRLKFRIRNQNDPKIWYFVIIK